VISLIKENAARPMNLESLMSQNALKIDTRNLHDSQIMQQCFDLVEVFVMALDLSGEIIMVNNKAEEILNEKRSSLKGENFIETYISKENREYLRDVFRKISNEEEYPLDTEYPLIDEKDGRILFCNNTRIINDEDEVAGLLITGKDVSRYIEKKKQLKKNNKLYHKLANSIPNISLLVYNPDFRFLIAEGDSDNFISTLKDFPGKTVFELENENHRNALEPAMEKSFQGDSYSQSYDLNGQYYHIKSFPIEDDDIDEKLGMVIVQNVSSERLKEMQLEETLNKAEEENREKNSFFARVTHEIRTPLNAILGFTEQLMHTQLDEKQDEYLKIIDKSSEHLVALVNDVLFLSRINASEIRFDESPFKVKSVVKYVHTALKYKADEKGLRFGYQIDKKLDQVIIGDSFRLRQILINLLNNAIKFTDFGSVNIYCYVKEETEYTITLGVDVVDTGIGIKQENLEKIFNQFQQGDSAITKKYGGTGLGLTICKKLTEMQNGDLCVSSQEGVGTNFSFRIPYTRGSDKDKIITDTHQQQIPDLSDKTVLLVDDDSVNRLLGKVILEKLNCNPLIANSGEEAVGIIDRNKIDLILLDIHMPGMNGLDVARYVREKYPGRLPGIIAVTAAVMKDDVKVYYDIGINDFLIKPYKEVNLYNKIVKIFSGEEISFQNHAKEMKPEKESRTAMYDLNELREMSGNNQEFINKMLTTFIENSEDALEDFRKLLPKGKWKELGEAAHKILPSYRHLKVNHIVKLLEEIKVKTLIDKEYNKIPILVNSAIAEIEEILPRLKSEIK
jgi:PAS domain S-box-containing protein